MQSPTAHDRWTQLRGVLLIAHLAAFALALSGCGRACFLYTTLPASSVTDLDINGKAPEIEVRNLSREPADLTIAGRHGQQVEGPALPLIPNGTWRMTFRGEGFLRITNNGTTEVPVQIWAPGWVEFFVTNYPEGLDGRPIRPLLQEGPQN